MYAEADCVALSALRHFRVCPRQCALIHLEQIWEENVFTAEGRLLHEKADSGKVETRGDLKTVTGLPIRSLELGVSGRADVVEFHRREGVWYPFPVEYKRGRPKVTDVDTIQLCAQAMCLEEMLGQPVLEGALFYGKTRRRLVVTLNDALRKATREVAAGVHMLIERGITPPPVADEHCASCSLQEQCLPLPLAKRGKASRYLRSLLEEA
ncbi:CRISPR-associated protein Cas4 [Desulfovibrio sp. OttesenSCG-928-G15]|nr:CRISPR-associated protein Cas4 [Desulfovibrio sp. OttesenSCG-928-G15]